MTPYEQAIDQLNRRLKEPPAGDVETSHTLDDLGYLYEEALIRREEISLPILHGSVNTVLSVLDWEGEYDLIESSLYSLGWICDYASSLGKPLVRSSIEASIAMCRHEALREYVDAIREALGAGSD